MQLFQRKRVVLLHTHEGDIRNLPLRHLGHQVIVDLAGVQHDAANRSPVGDLRIVDDRLELARGERGYLADRPTQSQHRLRCEHDQGATRASVGLSTKKVEIGCGRRGTRDRHVVLGAQLQVALDSRGRMIGPLALIPVRQQKHHTRPLAPLLFRARNELVDDGLGSVREVAELRLPEHEGIGSLDRVPVLEAHRRVLAEQRIVDPEFGLSVCQVR